MKIGIIGGTFDPIHFGHLRSALEVKEGLGLKRVLFVPSFMPPHKPKLTLTPFPHRVNLLEIAIKGLDSFECCTIEEDLPIPSYTVNTLAALSRHYEKGGELYFLMGSDAFFDLTTWHDYKKIMEYAKLVVMVRDLNKEAEIAPFAKLHFPSHLEAGRIIPFEVTHMAISSSMIREILRAGRSPIYLLPRECIKYMEEYGINYGRNR